MEHKKYSKQNLEAEINFFNSWEGDLELHEEAFYDKILSLVKDHIYGHTLEAGCGSGAFGLRLKKARPDMEIIGIDLSEKMINLAREKNFYKELIIGNLEDKDIFKKEEFDIIFCPYILHHFPELDRVFKNFDFWLKPNGKIIVVDPNGSNIILKMSYNLRIFLSKFFKMKNAATINEKPKEIKEFKNHLEGYKIILLKSFDHFEQNRELRKKLPLFINFLVEIKNILVRIIRGSQIIIIAEKI